MSETSVEYDAGATEAPAPSGEPEAAAEAVQAEAPIAAPADAGLLGALVLFCLNRGPSAGAWRPALCVGLDPAGGLNLLVFPDPGVDELMGPLYERAVTAGDDPGRYRVRA